MALPHRYFGRCFPSALCGIVFVLCCLVWVSGLRADGQTSSANLPTSAGTEAKPASPVTIPDYTISPDDVLEVYILDVPELSRMYRVNQSGQLVFPLLPKPLTAAGLTLDAFSDLLASELKSSGTISDPHISVSIKESRLHAISITGAVKTPQVYPLLGPTKLLAVLTQAGGISDDAGSEVKIVRGGAANASLGSAIVNSTNTNAEDTGVITVNLNELFAGINPLLNADVYPGDWVNVARAGVIYVVGAVNRPGGFVLNTSREHLTVLQLVALAEDLKPTAKREHTIIIRRRQPQDLERQEIAIDLKKVLKGKSPDIPLEPNDILFVPDSAGSKALRRGAEAAIQLATGLALFRL
ncbi:MAG TPA: polysaccharide biosynthesis/export family protein [Candidatus Angelobacter sp.]|nr:polysaccharide biosynthesis/export family protein [Candidatus Angelobacter sp.]